MGILQKHFIKSLNFVSGKIGINLLHIFSYPLSKLYCNRIIDNLFIFGSTNGNAFAGNSRVIFEYLCENMDYYCVWMTASRNVYDYLKKRNYNVLLSTDIFKAIKFLKSAKLIFITHGFGDISLIDFSIKTKLIFLAHGISFKKGGDDIREGIFQRKIKEKLLKDITIFIDNSEQNIKFKMSAYGLPYKKFLITGYPRNDILCNYTNELKKEIKNRLLLEENHEIILYAPTFREYQYKSPLNEEFLSNLNESLIKEKKILLYKPHPFRKKLNLNKYKNIKSIDPNIDITDLLIISDILITDYSSVFIDYLLTDKPVIFFAHDLDQFKRVRDFYYDYESFVPGPIVKSGNDLIDKLKDLNKLSKDFKEKREKARKIFFKYADGKALERIVKFLNLN